MCMPTVDNENVDNIDARGRQVFVSLRVLRIMHQEIDFK